MTDWMYNKVQRVPPITDEQIAEMRHIEPLLRVENSVMYRKIRNSDRLDPRNVSFLWDAKPTGGEFTFDTLNTTRIITQHHSSVWFKPSLAEVYAWIRVYMPETWREVKAFCMGEAQRIGSSCDFMCHCEIMGGRVLVQGRPISFGGPVMHELVEQK